MMVRGRFLAVEGTFYIQLQLTDTQAYYKMRHLTVVFQTRS